MVKFRDWLEKKDSNIEVNESSYTAETLVRTMNVDKIQKIIEDAKTKVSGGI